MKRYAQVERYVREHPWAILRGTLEAMLEALAMAQAGREWTAEELEERIADGPGKGTPARVGSVAVLPITGVIIPRADLFSEISGGTSLETFRSQLADVVRDGDVKAIALDVNSPGGSTELLTETAAELREARGVKPVVAIANTLAASAAYHLASQASEVFVTPSGHVGAIGVYTAHTSIAKAQEQAGVKTTLIAAGKYKVEGNPYEPLGKEAAAELQRRVDAAYDLFVADVAAGRRVSEDAIRNGYGEGRVYDAKRAATAGMVDGIQTFDATLGALLASGESGRATSSRTIDVTITGDTSRLERSFVDEFDAAVSAIERVTADVARFPRITRRKRERLEGLQGRLETLLARPVELEELGEAYDLEAEAAASVARARLAGIS